MRIFPFKKMLENYANDELIEGLSALSQEQQTCTGNRSKLKEKIESSVTKLSFIEYEELDESIISEIHHHHLSVINNLTNCPQLSTNNNSISKTNHQKSHLSSRSDRILHIAFEV